MATDPRAVIEQSYSAAVDAATAAHAKALAVDNAQLDFDLRGKPGESADTLAAFDAKIQPVRGAYQTALKVADRDRATALAALPPSSPQPLPRLDPATCTAKEIAEALLALGLVRQT